MTQRIATTSDIDTLIELRIAYLTEDHGALSADTEAKLRRQLPDYFCRHLGSDLRAFIAEENGEAVSCCFLLVTEKPAGPRFPDGLTGTVLNVYTRPDYRCHGIAGQLMKKLLAEARELRLDYVELKATKGALKLYKSIGFEEVFSKYTEMKFTL